MTETIPNATIFETTATGHPSAPVLAREAGVNPVDYMRSRGFVYDITDEDGLRALFDVGPVTLYQGFDPTGTSLHAGHMVGIMMLGSLQRMGHQPIALGGGGTAMVGDPSGRTSARELIREEDLAHNLARITVQLGRYLDYEGGQFGNNPAAVALNNADWLLDLRYIPFLRDIGRHFSVNEMLAAETYKTRLESTGLNFVEFNYRLVQAYDFLHLYREHGCLLQLGGSDQWGNIVAGVDLVRRADQGKAYAMVSPLVTTATGEKMGKTGTGVRVWLDPEMFSPYDYFQYWVNTDDRMVETYLKLLTFLPTEVIEELTSVEGEALREAKVVLALEATALAHGNDAAFEALAASSGLMSMVVNGLSNHLRSAALEAESKVRGSETVEKESQELAQGVSRIGTEQRTATDEDNEETSQTTRTRSWRSVTSDAPSPFWEYVLKSLQPASQYPLLRRIALGEIEKSIANMHGGRSSSEIGNDRFWSDVSAQMVRQADIRSILPALSYEDLFPLLASNVRPNSTQRVEDVLSSLETALRGVNDPNELLPTATIPAAEVTNDFTIADAFVAAGLAKGRGEARRLAKQGGLRVGDDKMDDVDQPFASVLGDENAIVLQAGKKRFQRVVIS